MGRRDRPGRVHSRAVYNSRMDTVASDPAHALLLRYLPWRRRFEFGYWVFVYLLGAAVDSLIVLFDVNRAHLAFAPWQPVVWEWSSHLVLLALVPAVIAFDRRFPLRYGLLRKNVPLHIAASGVFCLIHVAAMVGLRHAAYSLMGQQYDFGRWPLETLYEYLKDSRTYVAILLTVYLYRLLLIRAQGEARLLDAPDDSLPVEPVERPERFLVRKLGREFLVSAADIEWLQASANYVNLHVRSRDYPLRMTMAGIEPRLDPTRFVRVHRSYIVNLDCLTEIEPLESGDARLLMRDGTRIPCSRRYRSALRGNAAAG